MTGIKVQNSRNVFKDLVFRRKRFQLLLDCWIGLGVCDLVESVIDVAEIFKKNLLPHDPLVVLVKEIQDYGF